mmetsp:Transcript_35515/g.100514  ORF Transcript_35515/g.100514 Transcript_35515/m.100514 type:complete len:455 (+) Transcript_35515:132-1496(+)
MAALAQLRRRAAVGLIEASWRSLECRSAHPLRGICGQAVHCSNAAPNHALHEAASSFRLRQLSPATPWSPVRSALFHSSRLAMEDAKILVPSMGDSITEGTLVSLEKKVGDIVQENDVIAQIETDKVTIDVRYTPSTPGKITSIPVSVDDTVAVDQIIAVVEQGDFAAEDAPAGAAEPAAEAPKESAPAAAAAAAPPPPPPPPKATAAPSAPEPASPEGAGPLRERRVKMTRMRKRVAERLKGAQNTYAMLSTFNEVDMTNLIAMRNKYKDSFLEKHNVKLGFMSAFVKAAADALMMVPAVNAVIDGDDIVYRDYVDISIAVATPKGLVVPVLRDCDKMSYADIEKTINRYGAKARDGTLSIDEMAGGTFTISNGGVFGSMLSTPIINPPQSAILGMHATLNRPMVVGKDILPRPMMYIALTYDHRLIDGREAVTFLKRIKEVIEDPTRLLLEL